MTRVADVSVDFVAGYRARGYGWGVIARVAGCHEADLRRAFDPTYAATPLAGPAPTPRERVRKALVKGGFDGEQAVILSRLWQANGGRITGDELARGIIGGGGATDAVRDAIRAAVRRGFEYTRSGRGWALTADSVVRISRLAGLKDSEGLP